MATGLVLGLLASFGWASRTWRRPSRPGDWAACACSRAPRRCRSWASAIALASPTLLGPDPVWVLVAGLPLGFLAAGAYLASFTALRIGPVRIGSPMIGDQRPVLAPAAWHSW